MSEDLLRVGKHTFRSRLFIGTGKYKDVAETRSALEASGAEVITVALRRVNLGQRDEGSLMGLLTDPARAWSLLPNTAGCYTVDDAVRTCRLGRELGLSDMVKLEVIGDEKTLFPDNEATLEAAKILVAEGFCVLPYCTDDPVVCRKLQDVGCAAVMPLAAPIGSGLGIRNPHNLAIILEQARVPVIVDAGVGTASDASVAMELGCDGVLMNTAIAGAKNPVLMAEAMREAVSAGRKAFLAGRIARKLYASASSPIEGRIGLAPPASEREVFGPRKRPAEAPAPEGGARPAAAPSPPPAPGGGAEAGARKRPGDVHVVVDKLVKRFGDTEVLRGVSMSVRRGETAVIIGGSGAGKTTLLRILIGLEKPTSGSILVDGLDLAPLEGVELNRARRKFGMVFQYSALLDSLNIFDNVAFPLVEHTKLSKAEVRDKVRHTLEILGIGGTESRFPSELSGGMRKRVGLARALMLEPEILIYDEPTSGLDPLTSRMVDDLIEETRQRFGVTNLVISHDMASTFRIAHRAFLLIKGQVVAEGRPDDLLEGTNDVARDFVLKSGVDTRSISRVPPIELAGSKRDVKDAVSIDLD